MRSSAFSIAFVIGAGLAMIITSLVPQRDQHWVSLGYGIAFVIAGIVLGITSWVRRTFRSG